MSKRNFWDFFGRLAAVLGIFFLTVYGAVNFYSTSLSLLERQMKVKASEEVATLEKSMQALKVAAAEAQIQEKSRIVEKNQAELATLQKQLESIDLRPKGKSPAVLAKKLQELRGSIAQRVATLNQESTEAQATVEKARTELAAATAADAERKPSAAPEKPARSAGSAALVLNRLVKSAFAPGLLIAFAVAFFVQLLGAFIGRKRGGSGRLVGTLPALFLIAGIGFALAGVYGALPNVAMINLNDPSAKDALDGFLMRTVSFAGLALAAIFASTVLQFITGFKSTAKASGTDATSPKANEIEIPKRKKTKASAPAPDPKDAPRFVPPPVAAPKPAPVAAVEEEAPAFSPAFDEETPAVSLNSIPSAEEIAADIGMPSVEEFPAHVETVEAVNAPPNPTPDFDSEGVTGSNIVELPEDSAEPEPDRMAVLRHRLEVLNEYIAKADQDKADGIMPLEMWEEERAVYLEEKQRLETEMSEIEHLHPRAA